MITETVDAEAPTPLWLWCDTETTGLVSDRPAVLECAWMVTTESLIQLTPLRSRFTAITHPEPRSWRRLLRRPEPPWLTEWPTDLPEVVSAMHLASGLQKEWTAAAPDSLILRISHLDLLISADLDAAAARTDNGQDRAYQRVHLAGAGVAQYEARLLPALGSQITDWCHYRTADTSIAGMVTGIPKSALPVRDGLEIEPGLSSAAVTSEHRAAADVLTAYDAAFKLRDLVMK